MFLFPRFLSLQPLFKLLTSYKSSKYFAVQVSPVWKFFLHYHVIISGDEIQIYKHLFHATKKVTSNTGRCITNKQKMHLKQGNKTQNQRKRKAYMY